MDQHQPTINSFRRYHRAKQNVDFLNSCILNEVIPNFCLISDKVNISTKMSPKERDSLEKRKLFAEFEKQSTKTNIYKNSYDFLLNSWFSSLNTPSDFLKFSHNIERRVKQSESKADTIRNRKLAELINKSSPYYIKTKIINLTNITIPEDIENLLSLGPNNPIGGYVRNEGSDIFLGLDALNYKVKSVARKNSINELNIENLRCHISLTGQKLMHCNHKDIRVEKFLKFKKENPDLLFLKCDKSKNICLLNLTDYFVKLMGLFQNSTEFLKINDFNLTETMNNFKHLLKTTINSSLSNKTQLSIKPQMSISSLYATIKDHKENFPIRPIGTAYDSLTLGAEYFINNLLSPLRKNCPHAINSQIEFKTRFSDCKSFFDPDIHEIFTLDVNSLFPNINNTRTISYIINEVFKSPEVFFHEKNKKGDLLPYPTKEKFRKFLHGTLNNFNIFRCHVGVFSQKKGLKMGSPLSSLFADLFLGILDEI